MAFNVREVAEQLSVSTATVYGWVKRGELEHVRLGGNVIRIPALALERFMGGASNT